MEYIIYKYDNKQIAKFDIGCKNMKKMDEDEDFINFILKN